MLTLAQAAACSTLVTGAPASAPLQGPAAFLTLHISAHTEVHPLIPSALERKTRASRGEERSPDHSLQVEAAAFIRDSSIPGLR